MLNDLGIRVFKRSGIYKMNCSDCNKKYCGQRRRVHRTRHCEYLAYLKYSSPEDSAVTDTIFNSGHVEIIQTFDGLEIIGRL